MIVVKMAMRIAIIITIPMTPTTTPKSSSLIVNWLVAIINHDFTNHVFRTVLYMYKYNVC